MSEHLTESQLNDYAEGLLDDALRRLAAAHLATCPECRSAVAAIRSIREEAKRLGPPSHAPAGDLWPAIEARIREKGGRAQGGIEAIPGRSRFPSSHGEPIRDRRFWRRPTLLAAAALVLVSLSSALTLAVVRGGLPGGPEEGAPWVTTAGEESSTAAGFVAAREVEAAYEPTIQELRRALDQDRDRLDPETVRVVEESLRIIDQAMAEAWTALEEDPASQAATRSLKSMYDTKLQVLQRAVGLARSA